MTCTPSTPCKNCDLCVDDNPLLVGLRDGAWLDRQTFPPLRYAVPGVIPEGSTLLVGPPKIGKSWFVLALGLALASGGRMLGIPVGDSRPVLLLALEDGDRRMQDRCRKLLQGDPIPKGFQYMTRIEPGRIVDTVAAWLDRYGKEEPLVVIDTLGKVMPLALPGEGAYQRDYRVGSALKRVGDEYTGMSMLTNHHDRKAGADDFVDSVSGTHGLAGAADTIVVLARPRTESDGLLKVTGRDVPEGEYAVRMLDGCAWMLNGRTLDEAAAQATAVRASMSLGDRAASVAAIVARHPEGVRAADVAAEAGIDSKTAGDYLARLERAGRIGKWSRGVYGPLHGAESVASVESESVDSTVSTLSTPHEVTLTDCCGLRPGDLRHEINCVNRAVSVEAIADFMKLPAEDVAKIRADAIIKTTVARDATDKERKATP